MPHEGMAESVKGFRVSLSFSRSRSAWRSPSQVIVTQADLVGIVWNQCPRAVPNLVQKCLPNSGSPRDSLNLQIKHPSSQWP